MTVNFCRYPYDLQLPHPFITNYYIDNSTVLKKIKITTTDQRYLLRVHRKEESILSRWSFHTVKGDMTMKLWILLGYKAHIPITYLMEYIFDLMPLWNSVQQYK